MAVLTDTGYVFKDTDKPPPSMAENASTLQDLKSYPTSAAKKIIDFKNEVRASFLADSHDLARQENESKSETELQPGSEVRDLGWHKKVIEMPDELVGGVENGDLFARVRRFNKDIFDVQAIPRGKIEGLDLIEAWSDENATDKLTLHSERVYLSIILGLTSFGKHIARLRSWKETRRTTAFCLAYLLAWSLDFLIPLTLGTIMVIIGSERARNTLFPPVPIALVSISTGGLQKPPAGQLGTSDTITGAPERAIGEAREEEAANFVENARHLFARSIGMNGGGDEDGDPLEGKVPKPIRNGLKKVKEAGSAPGHATDKTRTNMTQKPMEDSMWENIAPKIVTPALKAAPHVIGEMADTWERFANAVSPTPPFSRFSYLRIEGFLVPLFLTSLFVPQYLVYKVVGFSIGFGLFGEPLILRGLGFLNKKLPNWLEMLEPKNNILRGIPTNNQVTITLLRIGEANRSPVPPIPSTKPTDPVELANVRVDEVPLDSSRREITQAIDPPPAPSNHETKDEKPKHRHLSKVIAIFKGNAKVAVETKLAVDHVRAAAGSEKAKGHLGILQQSKHIIYAGPAEYKARFSGKKGWLYISNPLASGTPRILFVGDAHRGQNGTLDVATEGGAIEWSMAVRDIRRLKRASALASTAAEKAAQWSEDTELLAGVEIVDEREKTWEFTAVPERDELFNRLVALGEQRWENM